MSATSTSESAPDAAPATTATATTAGASSEPAATAASAAAKASPARPGPAELRKFGLVVGGVFLAIGAWTLYREKSPYVSRPALGLGGALFLLGALAPALLYWPHRVWMAFAHALGWFNTRVILSALFYVVLTPIGLLMRLVSGDPMDRKIEPARKSYWHDREKKPFDPADYEHQF